MSLIASSTASAAEIETAVVADGCPVCGNRDSASVYSQARDPLTLDPFRVDECSDCGVVYTAPRPVTLDRYYPARYRAYGPFVTGILGALYDLRVSRWARLKPQGASVLEVGCGPGLMLSAFCKRGWRVFGMERNEAAAEMARQTLGAGAIATSIGDLPPDARFDLIVMFQVLEHIGEPVELLQQCVRLLAPGGLLIANVPNFASWQSRFARSRWMHLDVPRHLVHYTPHTLAATLRRAGLTISAMRFTSWEHDPFGWMESTISLLAGRSNMLTRFLMGIDPISLSVLFAWLLAGVLLAPALLLAAASWIFRRGALMEAMAVKSCAAADLN